MTAKQMKYDSAAHDDFRKGIKRLAKAVGLTLGPAGRNVVIQKSWGGPIITKDGVSVAKEIELPEAFQNMGVKMIHQVAKKKSRPMCTKTPERQTQIYPLGRYDLSGL